MKTLRALALLVASMFLAASQSFAETKIIAIPAPTSTPGNTTPVYAGAITANETLDDATGNEAAFQLNYTTNKATSGNDTGLEINMTDTASPGTSLLLDLQKGGVSQLSVNNAGEFIHPGTASMTATKMNFFLVGPTYYQMTADFSSTAEPFLGLIQASTAYEMIGTGPQKYILFSLEYNQTGAGGGTDLEISRKETALGSGSQKFISLQAGAAGTTEMYAISNKGIITESISAAITADSGSAQGGSPLTSSLNVITVVATAGDSVTLPTAAAGMKITITNRDAADSADVFPATDDSINGADVNLAKALAATATMQCFAVDATSWECLTLAR